MRNRAWKRTALLGGVATVALATAGFADAAEAAKFDIAPQPLSTALAQFGVQSEHGVFADSAITERKLTRGVSGDKEPELALNELLAGTGLAWRREGQAFVIVEAADPQSGSAAGDGADGTIDTLIVTAQKREEDIQDVPIAISAFSQEALERSQIAGGPDLITQVPNMTFTKTNFSSYSIQIRGIGTQAISATTDAAVAVALNNTSMIRNRFFEQEFYDLERVEVLRGPQGTLYGRNATAGAVNIITAKPKFGYEARLSGDVANYGSTRLEGMVNLPLVDDVVALRLAGAWTKRDGFVENALTGNPIDGRDLWSTRVSLRFEPTDGVSANLIWEHFQEDDDRLRSAKQLCMRDDRTEIWGVARAPSVFGSGFSQSCLPASLYGEESFQAPDGRTLPYYLALGGVFLPVIPDFDPYVSVSQSRDLRVIDSTVDPEYRAKSDVAELQVSIDLSDNLTLSSETAYNADTLFSIEDYNRFNTKPGVWNQEFWDSISGNPATWRAGVLENGVFCDPQLGCSDRLVAVDLSTAKSRQFSQEFRISSNYEGSFNFSLGANFLRYDTVDKYYVFINSLSMYSLIGNWNAHFPGGGFPEYIPGVTDNKPCLLDGAIMPGMTAGQPVTGCIYMDPNPIASLNDQGHNYFLSKNPYKLISYAVFGEAYYQITPALKLTAGLRFTVDKKDAPRIPSWLLAAETLGYPVAETVSQEWREPTGRLALDWKPDLGVTDETLLYASYAHGYKAGGANPPAAGLVTYGDGRGAVIDGLAEQSATAPKTFDPEFVDAFEVGAKNTLLDGRLTLNMSAFYYDYEGYQISYIVSRSAVNLNFDAKIWGLELETDWRPTDNLRIGLKGGYEKTRVADGMRAIDVMDRTAGHEGWMVVRPFPAFPNNCVLPVYTADAKGGFAGEGLVTAPNVSQNGNVGPCEQAWVLGHDPVTQFDYVADPVDGNGFPVQLYFHDYPGFDPDAHPEVNGGEGFYKDLSGKELPNAPKYTATLTADYTLPLPSDWLMTLHGDLHYQGESWARIYNTPGYDKLKAYTNLNLALLLDNEDAGWRVMAYVKNVFDKDAITGAFLNSDDTGLTTNVFLVEPRLYGLRVTKSWSGGTGLEGLFGGGDHTRGTPYPFEVEVGGGVTRVTADNRPYEPAFLDTYPSTTPFPQDFQNDDLDDGDERQVKLTYRLPAGWSLSAALRYGRANGVGRSAVYERLPTGTRTFPFGAPKYRDGPLDYGVSNLSDGEKHTLVDFAIGKDFGMGLLGEDGRSAVSLGLRYAQFDSRSRAEVEGAPDWFWPELEPAKYPTDHHHENLAKAESARSFDGTGPVLSWDASKRLMGDGGQGRIGLDWSLSGGVLFGKRQTEVKGQRQSLYFTHSPEPFGAEIVETAYNEPIHFQRSEDATVPTLGLTLGMSYTIDRVSVGAGYRWERYYDVIDGGIDKAESFDRTMDGPYLKLSIGFGN